MAVSEALDALLCRNLYTPHQFLRCRDFDLPESSGPPQTGRAKAMSLQSRQKLVPAKTLWGRIALTILGSALETGWTPICSSRRSAGSSLPSNTTTAFGPTTSGSPETQTSRRDGHPSCCLGTSPKRSGLSHGSASSVRRSSGLSESEVCRASKGAAPLIAVAHNYTRRGLKPFGRGRAPPRLDRPRL